MNKKNNYFENKEAYVIGIKKLTDLFSFILDDNSIKITVNAYGLIAYSESRDTIYDEGQIIERIENYFNNPITACFIDAEDEKICFMQI